MKKIVTWACIMSSARKQGELRKQGKAKEADKMHEDLVKLVKSCDEMAIPEMRRMI